MNKSLLALLLALPLLWACNDDDEQAPQASTLTMSFQPMYNGADMQLFTRYNNAHQCTFELSDLKFYISNITLHGNNAEDVLLSQIELIDIKGNANSLQFPLPAGNYSGVSFDIGVPVELNGTQNPEFLTSVYSLDHPLSATNGTYWAWASGYRFFMVDGRFDTIPDHTGDFSHTFSFHTGTDTLFRHAGTFNKSISGTGGASHMQFALDFEKFWASDDGQVDLRVERDFHGSPSQMELGHRIADNTVAVFRLKP